VSPASCAAYLAAVKKRIVHKLKNTVMSDTCIIPPPGSFVPIWLAKLRVANYRLNKRDVLTEWIQIEEQEPYPAKDEEAGLVYSVAEFRALINAIKTMPELTGVRVYFASYKRGDPNYDRFIPSEKENLLTLIFAPTTRASAANSHKDTGHYYIFDVQPPGTDRNLVNLQPIQIANFPWVTHFDKKAVALQKAPINPPTQETRSLWFGGGSFTDWLDEIDCRIGAGETVTGIYFAFAAYSAAEQVLPPGAPAVDVSHKLTLIIRIDKKPPTLAQRGNGIQLFYNLEKKRFVGVDTNKDLVAMRGDFDTSVPCPPAVCPITEP
jgi:hypothetical protein